MSKVEQGEPQTIRERTKVWFASLGYEWKSPANVRWCDIGGWIEKFIYEQLPESQPAPEMDYEKEALSLQDAIDNIVPCTEHEVAVIADWLRAHDARVQPSSVAGTERLREKLSEEGQ